MNLNPLAPEWKPTEVNNSDIEKQLTVSNATSIAQQETWLQMTSDSTTVDSISLTDY